MSDILTNEDNDNLVAELEAAAISWMLNKTKYTLECLRDARGAVLKRMQPPAHEPCDGPRRAFLEMPEGYSGPVKVSNPGVPVAEVTVYPSPQGASRDAPSGEPVYRKWPGEPPHCMSCSCGMTDEQKRTVPEADYLRIHRELMDLKYPGGSPADLVGALQDVVHTDPGPVRAGKAHRDASSDVHSQLHKCEHCGAVTSIDCVSDFQLIQYICGTCGKETRAHELRT